MIAICTHLFSVPLSFSFSMAVPRCLHCMDDSFLCCPNFLGLFLHWIHVLILHWLHFFGFVAITACFGVFMLALDSFSFLTCCTCGLFLALYCILHLMFQCYLVLSRLNNKTFSRLYILTVFFLCSLLWLGLVFFLPSESFLWRMSSIFGLSLFFCPSSSFL